MSYQHDYVRKLLTVVVMSLLLVFLGTSHAMAATALEDGEYTINYEILRGDTKDDSTSLADGYWNKPAKVFVKDGNITVQTTINQHAWVVAFATQYNGKMVDAKVVSTNEKANSRVTEFKVKNFEDMLLSEMTVEIPEMDYYHSYEVRFKFYPDSLKSVGKPAETAKPTATPKPTAKPTSTAKVTPEPTKDTSSTGTSPAKPTTSTKPQATTDPMTPSSSNGSGSDSATSDPNASSSPDDSKVVAGSEGSEIGINGNEDASTKDDAEVLTGEKTDDVVVVSEQGITANEAVDGATDVETEQFTVDKEEKQGGTIAIVLIIIVAVLFIAGAIAWIVMNRKRNK
ncbi:MAG: NEAT domain-containing protein [Candidatus Pristimantibacillus lignocellulolyticus]|uniref:NEAT domain-containing protein n=1 Tax=Candidatus Pristimantibacillus lignocellulolyticus TaxID=2994561 RepID=A0A9J6ZL02_9BACL|nr:MAG: NEAT domain-containing protein [Candidatus Pristimantibacillus lignocellulolyticus]